MVALLPVAVTLRLADVELLVAATTRALAYVFEVLAFVVLVLAAVGLPDALVSDILELEALVLAAAALLLYKPENPLHH